MASFSYLAGSLSTTSVPNGVSVSVSPAGIVRYGTTVPGPSGPPRRSSTMRCAMGLLTDSSSSAFWPGFQMVRKAPAGPDAPAAVKARIGTAACVT